MRLKDSLLFLPALSPASPLNCNPNTQFIPFLIRFIKVCEPNIYMCTYSICHYSMELIAGGMRTSAVKHAVCQ